MTNDTLRSIRGLNSLVGNTSLLTIELEFKGRQLTLYAKAENFNMTGSIEDRMIYYTPIKVM